MSSRSKPHAAAPGATLADLPELLRALLSADNDVRGRAEATLKAVAKDPQVVPALLNHARSDADPQVRQLAAVVLKRRVLAHWSKLPRDHQEQVKNILLDAIVKEPLGVVRRSVAGRREQVAKATVPMGQWNQLPEFLAQCTQSPEEAHRDVAFVLFASLTETIISVMTQHFATLGGLFRAGLGDASLSVRLAALRAVLALICNMSGEPGEIKIAQELVPHVISTARNAIAAGEETNAGLAYEVLDELIESQPKALAGHIPDVVGFCVEVASAPGLESVTRRRALDVIAFLARYKPKALLRAKLVAPLLRVLCPLCGEPKEEQLAGEDDAGEAAEEEMHVQTVAAQLVDLLAIKVPAKHVLPEVLSFASPAISDADPKRRHAATACLGIVAEGCAEGLSKVAPDVTPLVVRALRDPSPDVRGAAAFTLGQFAEFLNYPDESAAHAVALPELFAAMPTEADRKVQERMMYAMDSWLETLEDEVGPYVEPLLRIVFMALDSPDARPQVREMLLSATASAAAAAGDAMHPHLSALLPRLERCLVATGDADLKPRARALEVLGMLVSARGGREAMAPHVPAAMAAAASGFELDYSELREYGHAMFAEVAEALGEDFAPYLASCVKKAIATLELDDGVVYDSDEEDAERGGAGDSDSEEDLDSDGEDAGGRRGASSYSVFSGVVEEKAAACRAVSSYAHHCPAAFKGHIGEFLDKMGRMADYMHEIVRAQAHGALARMAQCALIAAPPPAQDAFPVVDAALNAAHRALAEDDDRDSASAAMESAAEVIKSVAAAAGGGIAHLERAGHVKGLSDLCLAVLEGRAACQEGDDDEDDFALGRGGDDDEDDDEEAELGQIALEGCAELLPALAAVAGGARVREFEPHFAALLRRASDTRPEGQRSVAYATLVEVIRAFGPAAAPAVPAALPGCLRELTRAESAGLRRNCAYCAGVMAEVGGKAIAPLRADLAAALARLASAAERDRGVRDNAASAATRVLLADDAAVARDFTIGPALLDAALDGLPLEEDFEEARAAYGGVGALLDLAGEIPHVATRAPKLVATLARAAAEETARRAKSEAKSNAGGEARRAAGEANGATDETLAEIGAAVARASARAPEAVAAAVAAAPPEHQTALRALVGS